VHDGDMLRVGVSDDEVTIEVVPAVEPVSAS
jgi:hypothetical protein